jgi:hypothetical protein
MAGNTNNREVTGWVGWIAFAGGMLILAGIFQFIIGLTALLNQNYFVATSESVLLFNLATWGWLHMLLGILLGLTGASLFSGNVAGRTVAVILAGLSAVANLTFLGAYPFWSIIMITVDILIIYALTVHGGEMREATR